MYEHWNSVVRVKPSTEAVVMTTIMSPAVTKAQVHAVAGYQPSVLGRSKGISSQSEDKKSIGT